MVISCSKYFVQVKRYNGSDWRSIFYISILLSTSDYKLIINKIYETTLKIKNKSPSFQKSRNKFSKILINHAIYFCDIKRRERSSIKLPATHKPNQSPNLKSQNQFLNIPGHPSNQPSLFLSLINPILSNNIPFFFTRSTTHFDHIQNLFQTPNVSCSLEIIQSSNLPFPKNTVKKIKTAAETSVEDGWRIPLGGVPADFSHRDSRTVGRITRIAGGVGGWRRGPNEISRYVNAGRRVRGLSLSLSLYEAEEPDTGERFAVVPGRWMCATPTRGNRGPTSTACLSLSLCLAPLRRTVTILLPSTSTSSTRVSYAFCFM